MEHLLRRNVEWATERKRNDPDYFRRLAGLQAPEYLWIGCSDSRVPANVITGLQPGEVFVHRNVANLVNPGDLNCLSVLQFAVDVLRVRHIIVCGHYGCGGVRAALDDQRHGLIDYWLQPIRDLAERHESTLAGIADHGARLDRLCELSVKAQVRQVAETPIVVDAWARGQTLAIHGWVYGLDDGLLRDLRCSRAGTGAGPA
jgi:carbonic anhydrase